MTQVERIGMLERKNGLVYTGRRFLVIAGVLAAIVMPITINLCSAAELPPQVPQVRSVPQVNEDPYLQPAKSAPEHNNQQPVFPSLRSRGRTPHGGNALARPTLEKGVFLVASRELADPNFSQSVVLLVDYGLRGAMGIVINQPTKVMLAEVIPAISQLADRQDPLYLGGPVARDQILLLMRTHRRPADAAHVFADIFFSASETALKQVLEQQDSNDHFHAYLGYAGWAPGQLEDEVARGDWYISAGQAATVFEQEPSEIWNKLIQQNSGLWVWGTHTVIATVFNARRD